MIFLEIAMILIGLGAVIYSIRISETPKKDLPDTIEKGTTVEEEEETGRLQEMLDTITQKAETVCNDFDDRMSQISNEKIMGISEYSDQVLEKIEKNHEEVVFLYDMMNEKQEELKNLVHDVDSMKADFHDETAKEYQKMKEQEAQLDELKKSMELDFLQFQSEQNKFRQEFEKLKNDMSDSMENLQEKQQGDGIDEVFDAGLDDDDLDSMEEFKELLAQPAFSIKGEQPAEDHIEMSETASVYDAEIARIEEEEAKESHPVREQYQSNGQQDEMVNHNDEIISLYKKGRSVLEISKMLSLGQGEVKFVIDLYNAR